MSKTVKTLMVILLLAVSLTLSFGAGCDLDITNSSDTSRALDTVEEAWEIIFENYVDQERIDAGALSRAAIKAMITELDDPYTSYLSTERYQASMEELSGKFEGIGAYVGMREEQVMIIAPIVGSPAETAGIRAGDIILGINGDSTEGLSLEEAVLLIRGPKGTSVRLLILHEGETESVEIEIIRAEIKLSSVYFEMKEDIAYIQIAHFTERTDEELTTILENISANGAAGIILDLRSNPGGLLETVIEVASHFLEKGVVLYVVDNKGEQTPSQVKTGGITTDLPVVVLVDSYSASGSEVLAGALQDHDRAIVAGAVTYGKGSVNTLHRLTDGSGFYITTGRWLTPDGRVIEGKGVIPDYELDLENEDPVQWAMDYLQGN